MPLPVPTIVLAPMEGLLDVVLRDVLTRMGGIDRCVSEFIRITDQLLPERVFTRIVPELLQGSCTLSGVPVRPQFLGSDPRCMADNAACIATLKPAGLDLNFGCPAKIVNRHGGGAALLQDPDRLYAIASAVRQALPAGMTLSAKMRLGYLDDSLAVECAQALAAGGIDELVVHARTKVQAYNPPAYWHRIADIRAAIAIPIIANGEIWTVQDAHHARHNANCSHLMLGRGVVADPGLGIAIKRSVRGALNGHGDEGIEQPLLPLPLLLQQGLVFGPASGAVPWEQVQSHLHDFWQLVTERIERKAQAGRLKQWLNFLRRRYPEAQQAFDAVKSETDPKRVGEWVRAAAALEPQS
jgi:tRNA-dihydrouridine synthase C